MPTILVADDNSNIQKMVGIALKEHGITVVAVGNGEAAVRKMAESLPDLILADIFMPVRNGYEVCEYVKKDERFAHIPVVLLVGAFDPLDEKEVERVRADGVLKKPFVPPDPLIELVKSLLGKIADAAAAGAAGAGPGETQELVQEEDVERTQDLVPGLAAHSPTGTLRMPAPEVPPVERTQRLTPETIAPSGSGAVEMPRPPEPPARTSSGTVEVRRPDIPPPDRTQRLAPEGSPVSAENFRLGLDEPKPAEPLEETQKLTVRDISDILKRESKLGTSAAPGTEEKAEGIAAPPAAVDFHGEAAPLAFEDMLRPTEQEEEAAEEQEEEESRRSHLDLAPFDAAGEHASVQETESAEVEEEQDEAEVRFGGIREEAKTPDPELPPIPVDFGHSEPVEIITEEHAESSEVNVGPAQDLVTSSSGWAASTGSGEPHAGSAGEPGLMPGGAEAVLTPAAAGIAREEAAPVREFAIPPEPPAESPAPEEFEETSELPKHILQEEVNRAQEIAARVAAQNREFIAREEAQGVPASQPMRGPGIDHVISAADTILARHRAQIAGAEAAAPPSPAPVTTPPVSSRAEQMTPTVAVPRISDPEMIEAISERVLAQLDPYIIEKISKEIVRPIVEAMIRHEL
ncbi:MAG TPA: response regulator, partial [Candidatus Acidoferrales bacterium]|nr:response regulator [Candidatus Acidoferrales bacterium]